MKLALLLFDLDGTLIDSAPDLAGAANDLRQVHGLPPLPYGALRPMVGAGARGMVGVAFGVAPGDERFEPSASQVAPRSTPEVALPIDHHCHQTSAGTIRPSAA